MARRSTSFSLLRVHASRICENELHRAIHRRVLRKAWIATAIYAASMPLAFLDIRLAWAIFLATPAMFFLPVVRPAATPSAGGEATDGPTKKARA